MHTNSQCVSASLHFAAAANDPSGPFVHKEVAIHSARSQHPVRSLDREGFSLYSRKSSIRNFYDPDEVRERYYAELEGLAREATGASHAFVFTHVVRCAAKADAGMNTVQRPFHFIHNDYTLRSGPLRAAEALGARAEELMRHRYSIINIWRSIRGTVEESPLAVCDARTVSEQDPVQIPSQDPTGRTIRIYALAFNSRQRWFYFPNMAPDEALVFKTFDSADDGRARFTFHTAFTDPVSPRDVMPRESIEARIVVVFDQRTSRSL